MTAMISILIERHFCQFCDFALLISMLIERPFKGAFKDFQKELIASLRI